jgi:glycosyltransferase involved in cell wall biosynthesis
MNSHSTTVAIIQEHLHHYRVAFYHHLRDQLEQRNIELALYYDQETSPCDELDSETWVHHTPAIRMGKLTWQRLPRIAKSADLIVFQQQVRYPNNLLRILSSPWHGQKTAFWGHGHCFAEGWENRWSEMLKAWLSTKVDHWFAYNDKSARVVRNLGYPEDRITHVQNAVDTTALREAHASVTDEQKHVLKKELGIDSDNICVFTGQYYINKNLPFLIVAAESLREMIPDFHLLMIGSGPDEHLVTEAAARHPWIHSLGRLDGTDKIPYWAISKLLLIPGLVGLVIIDSFAAGLPLVTTDFPNHSHEIDYLRHGENGWMTDTYDDPAAYARDIAKLLFDEHGRSVLSSNCLAASSVYSIENMAANFAEGVLQALSETPLRNTASANGTK